jgi:hypothetical protein
VKDDAFSVHKDNNNKQHEIPQLLEEKKELLQVQVIGTAPTATKPDGILRLAYQNVDTLLASFLNNAHLNESKEVLNDLEADTFAFNEHRNHLHHQDNKRHSLRQLFQGGETMVRGIGGSINMKNWSI